MANKKKKYDLHWNPPVLRTFTESLEGQCGKGTLATASASSCADGTSIKYSYCSGGHVAYGKSTTCSANGSTAATCSSTGNSVSSTKQKYDCIVGTAPEDGAGCVSGLLPSNPSNCNAGGAAACSTGASVES